MNVIITARTDRRGECFYWAALLLMQDGDVRVQLGHAGADLYRREFDMPHVVQLLRKQNLAGQELVCGF